MASDHLTMEDGDKCSFNTYLLHVLQKRSSELKAAYQRIVQLERRAHNANADAVIQTDVETLDVGLQTQQSSVVNCDECRVLKETVQTLRQQANDLIQSLVNRDGELGELKKQLTDSVNSVDKLRSRANAEEAARKVKEERVEELEELILVCKSESLASEQEQHIVVENWSRENAHLKSELNALKASLQAKEEVLAQNMLEKDDLEDANDHIRATNTSLQRQLDELQRQLKDQHSRFETELQHLAGENQQLMEKMQSVSTELTQCQQPVSVSLGCSQPIDLLASQQSSELSVVKLELLTVQAEKEDLIEQLHQCRDELSSLRNGSCQSDQWNSKTSATSVPAFTKPPSTAPSRQELESQNAELLGQLLVLEDQLSESEVLLQESRDGRQQSAEELTTTLKQLSDLSARVVSLQQEKRDLETELNAAKTSLETSDMRLQECKNQLSLVEGKLSSAGNRQRQLMCQKQLLESQNGELLRRLQQASAAPAQHVASLSSPGTSHGSVQQVTGQVEVKENQIPCISKLPASTKTFQPRGNRQMMKSVDGTGQSCHNLAVDAESRASSDTTVSASGDRKLVACTTSPAELLRVCQTPTSVCSERTAHTLKRRIVEYTADTGAGSGGKRHLFGSGN